MIRIRVAITIAIVLAFVGHAIPVDVYRSPAIDIADIADIPDAIAVAIIEFSEEGHGHSEQIRAAPFRIDRAGPEHFDDSRPIHAGLFPRRTIDLKQR